MGADFVSAYWFKQPPKNLRGAEPPGVFKQVIGILQSTQKRQRETS